MDIGSKLLFVHESNPMRKAMPAAGHSVCKRDISGGPTIILCQEGLASDKTGTEGGASGWQANSILQSLSADLHDNHGAAQFSARRAVFGAGRCWE
jgi:hypothetical protein